MIKKVHVLSIGEEVPGADIMCQYEGLNLMSADDSKPLEYTHLHKIFFSSEMLNVQSSFISP